MKTLNELVGRVSFGADCVEDQVRVDRLYDAKCYRVGKIIRIDLKPVDPREPVAQMEMRVRHAVPV